MDMEETQPSKYPEIKNWFPTFSKWLFGTSG